LSVLREEVTGQHSKCSGSGYQPLLGLILIGACERI
jgi:hypothetical protein